MSRSQVPNDVELHVYTDTRPLTPDTQMDFLPTLSAWQWALLAVVPPAIVALYFLKLRRQPLEVPSTYLWQKSIEDLHVNSLWQRIRQSLLLYLQLLLLLLVIFALLRPGWRSGKLQRRALHFSDRQLGQHERHRCRSLAAGRSQAAGDRADRRNGQRR